MDVASEGRTHTLTGTVNVPAKVDELSFKVTGKNISVEEQADPPCSQTKGIVTCAMDRRNAAGRVPVDFRVEVVDPDADAVTMVTLQLPDGYADDVVSNNFDDETIVAPTEPTADLDLSELDVRDQGAKHHVTGKVSGVPMEVDELFFTLTDTDAEFERSNEDGIICDVVNQAGDVLKGRGTRVRCTSDATTADQPRAVHLDIHSPNDVDERATINVEPAAGYTDFEPTNNVKQVVLPGAQEPEDDVVLESLTQEWTSPGSNTVRAAVSGVPDSVDVVEFHLTEADDETAFVIGEHHATGEGEVECEVDKSDVATCRRLTDSFWVDIHATRRIFTTDWIRITVVPVDLNEEDTTDNSDVVRLDWPKPFPEDGVSGIERGTAALKSYRTSEGNDRNDTGAVADRSTKPQRGTSDNDAQRAIAKTSGTREADGIGRTSVRDGHGDRGVDRRPSGDQPTKAGDQRAKDRERTGPPADSGQRHEDATTGNDDRREHDRDSVPPPKVEEECDEGRDGDRRDRWDRGDRRDRDGECDREDSDHNDDAERDERGRDRDRDREDSEDRDRDKSERRHDLRRALSRTLSSLR